MSYYVIANTRLVVDTGSRRPERRNYLPCSEHDIRMIQSLQAPVVLSPALSPAFFFFSHLYLFLTDCRLYEAGRSQVVARRPGEIPFRVPAFRAVLGC